MTRNSKEELEGLVREAMALRVKYRFKDRVKRPVHIDQLCIHKHNRGGQYPQSGTVENLGIHIFNEGFDAEEANHEGECVQELPVHERPNWHETSFE